MHPATRKRKQTKENRKQLKLIRNRISAKKSRMKKKEFIQSLEEKIEILENKIELLESSCGNSLSFINNNLQNVINPEINFEQNLTTLNICQQNYIKFMNSNQFDIFPTKFEEKIKIQNEYNLIQKNISFPIQSTN